MSDMIKRIATAICLAESRNPMKRRETSKGTMWEWELRTPAVRAALAAIKDAGYAVVPVEPTKAMPDAVPDGETEQ